MVSIDNKGYIRNDEDKLISRKVAYEKIYRKNRDKYPLPFSEYEVHHRDRQKLNNSVRNLDIVTREEHQAIHDNKLRGKKELDEYNYTPSQSAKSYGAGSTMSEEEARQVYEEERRIYENEKREEEETRRKREFWKIITIVTAVIIIFVTAYFRAPPDNSLSRTYAKLQNNIPFLPKTLLSRCVNACGAIEVSRYDYREYTHPQNPEIKHLLWCYCKDGAGIVESMR